ncbi:MAG: FkbM family methyltransferase [Lentisphaeria bacterium]|nr:FkbM family methyltransferase [Lentisphaeria bacterium]
MKKYTAKIRRIIHKILLFLMPDCRYKQEWLTYYRFRSSFEDAGYAVAVKRDIVRISGNGIVITGNSGNTILTAHGILCGHEYDFFSPFDCIVVDIGLNIGIASVFFAQKNNVKKVYAYEPFLPTLKQALENLSNNPFCEGKVETFPFGLGNAEKELTIHYNADQPGSMSTVRDVYPDSPVSEKVVIKSAASELSSVFTRHPDFKKVFKIDCEGSEVEILQDLQSGGLLQQIDLILLEWHWGCAETLIQELIKNGFALTCRHDIPNKQGVIIAFRNSSDFNGQIA